MRFDKSSKTFHLLENFEMLIVTNMNAILLYYWYAFRS